jgi:hypothetical protein
VGAGALGIGGAHHAPRRAVAAVRELELTHAESVPRVPTARYAASIVSRHVRGLLFADYVRMIRGRKDVEWWKYLQPDDMRHLVGRVDKDAWYPMDTFERLGVCILRTIAGGQLDAVTMFGRFQLMNVVRAHPNLLAEGEPRETLMRFQVLRRTFFDYDALDVLEAHDQSAICAIAYGMGSVAEEAASHQTFGFFQELVEKAGGKNVYGRFASKSWLGDDLTRVELDWR